MRYATPSHFTTANAVSDASRIAPSPNDTMTTRIRFAACMPTPFQTPRRNPWFNPLETLEKTPGPGVIDNTTVVTKYVSQTVSSIGVPRPLRASKERILIQLDERTLNEARTIDPRSRRAFARGRLLHAAPLRPGRREPEAAAPRRRVGRRCRRG